MKAEWMNKKILAIIAGIGFLMPLGLFATSGADGGADSNPYGVMISEGRDNYTIAAQSYTAIIDKPFGNLIALYNGEGKRMLGCDNGTIRGICAYWNDSTGATHIQRDDGGCPDVKITVSGNIVYVSSSAFEEQYIFWSERIEVKLHVLIDALLGDDFHLLFGSEEIRKYEFLDEADHTKYTEPRRDNYLTDFTTDLASGERSIINRHVIDDRAVNPTTVAGLYVGGTGKQYSLDGMGTWYLRAGKVWFEKGNDNVFSSIRHKDACQFIENGDNAYVVAQASHYLFNEDKVHLRVGLNPNGYTVKEISYPVPTNNGTNNGLCKARVVIPLYPPPEGGYNLLMANHGHGGNAWDNCFMWDFLGNEGYIVAASNWTNDCGPNDVNHDLGYNQQIEIEWLRQWVLKNYNVDGLRQYATGLSLGGLNTFLCPINHPEAYAAIVPYSPAYEGRIIAYFLGTSTDPYAIAVGNPRERPEQTLCPIMVICGDAGLDAALDAQIPLIMQDHPGAKFHFSNFTGHDLRTWESYRKEVFEFIESNTLPDSAMDNVNGRFFGAITGQVPTYVDNGMRTYHNNSWMSAGPLQNDTFTTINASRIKDREGWAYRFKANLTTSVLFAKPEGKWKAKIVTGNEEITVLEETTILDGKEKHAVTFTAEGDKEYAVSFERLPGQIEKPARKFIPGFEMIWAGLCLGSIVFYSNKKRRER